MTALILAAILATGHPIEDAAGIVSIIDSRYKGSYPQYCDRMWLEVPITATIEYDIWPEQVGVRCIDLYRNPRPQTNVRLVGECRGASLYYLDVWDGSVEGGRRLGVRVYFNKIDCRTLNRGWQYIVDGFSVVRGSIYATDVREANP